MDIAIENKEEEIVALLGPYEASFHSFKILSFFDVDHLNFINQIRSTFHFPFLLGEETKEEIAWLENQMLDYCLRGRLDSLKGLLEDHPKINFLKQDGV